MAAPISSLDLPYLTDYQTTLDMRLWTASQSTTESLTTIFDVIEDEIVEYSQAEDGRSCQSPKRYSKIQSLLIFTFDPYYLCPTAYRERSLPKPSTFMTVA